MREREGRQEDGEKENEKERKRRIKRAREMERWGTRERKAV